MAIDFEFEKNKKFSSDDMYAILSFATQVSEANGYVSSFVMQRAIYVYASIIAYQEKKEEIAALASESVLDAWDALVQDGTIEQLQNDFPHELDYLGSLGAIWYDEFVDYSNSARGLLDNISDLAGDMFGSAVGQFKNAMSTSGASDVLQIADEWGMNNGLTPEERRAEMTVVSDEESLLD